MLQMRCPDCKEKGYDREMIPMIYTWGGVKLQSPYYKCSRCTLEIKIKEDSSSNPVP